MEKPESHVHSIVAARTEWLDEVLAGLISIGFGRHEIEVREHPGLRTEIVVRGVVRYEWKLTLDVKP